MLFFILYYISYIYSHTLESWKYALSYFVYNRWNNGVIRLSCRSKQKKNGGKQVQLEFQTINIICDFVIIKR